MIVDRPGPATGQGPRITELWAWTALDPMTDTEGIVATVDPRGGGMPLVATVREMAERLRPLAELAVLLAEEPRPTIALRRFVPAEEES